MGSYQDVKKICTGVGDFAAQQSCEDMAEHSKKCDSLEGEEERNLCEDSYALCDSVVFWPAKSTGDQGSTFTFKHGAMCRQISYILAGKKAKLVSADSVELEGCYPLPKDFEGLKAAVAGAVDSKWLDEKEHRIKFLMKNLSYIRDLIKSEGNLLKAAAAIADFIKSVEEKFGYGIVSGQAFSFESLRASFYPPDMGSISDCVNSVEELPAVLEKYVEIMGLFEFKGFNPASDEPDPYEKMKGLGLAFHKYGFYKMYEIAKSGGKSAVNFYVYEDRLEVVDKYGFEYFLDIAKYEGEQASSYYSALYMTHKYGKYGSFVSSYPIVGVIEKYGKDNLIFMLKQAHDKSYKSAYVFFDHLYPAIRDLVESKYELRVFFDKVMPEMEKAIETPGVSSYELSKFYEYFKNEFKSAKDVIFLLERVSLLSVEIGCSAFYLFDIVKAAGVKDLAGLGQAGSTLIKAATSTSKSKSIHLIYAEMLWNKGDYAGVLRALDHARSMLGDEFDYRRIPELYYRSALALLFGDELDATSESNGAMDPKLRGAAVAALETVCAEYGGSPAKDRSEVLLDVVKFMEGGASAVSIVKNDGITVKRYEGSETVSIIYVDGSVVPEVVPGEVKFSKKGDQLVIPNYYGGYKVVFKKPKKTISLNGDALLKAMHELPPEFFEKVDTVIFTGEKHEDAAGDYLDNVVRVHEGSQPYGTVVHEFGHHWDLGIEKGKGGVNGGKGDISKLFYHISWKGVKKSKYASMEEYMNKTMDRDDFDEDDFVSYYAMRNPCEDIAEAIDEYVTNGPEFRKKIREQLGAGNFELATKYLYVKHLAPFKGMEYDVGDKSKVFEFDELYAAIEKSGKGSVDQNTLDIISEIADRSGNGIPASLQ